MGCACEHFPAVIKVLHPVDMPCEDFRGIVQRHPAAVARSDEFDMLDAKHQCAAGIVAEALAKRLGQPDMDVLAGNRYALEAKFCISTAGSV